MNRLELTLKIEEIIDAHITVDYEDKHARAAAEDIVDLLYSLEPDS